MAHVLVLPYPMQSHINPMLQFAKRLAIKGPRTTLVLTHFIINTVDVEAGPVHVEPISDGHDEGGMQSAVTLEDYFQKLDEFGSKTLEELILAHENSGIPFTCMIYDSFVPWGLAVAKKLGLPAIAFSTQSCAVSAIYYYVNEGKLDAPGVQAIESLEGLPPMERSDFPSFAFRNGSYPTLTAYALNQFKMEKDDWVLFNSFDELESEHAERWSVGSPMVRTRHCRMRVESMDGIHLRMDGHPRAWPV
ncbi:indole-3-acetate beta-glucosyltransferase-like [Elaeis guineensis]